MKNYKIGFCCKFLHKDRDIGAKNLAIIEREMNTRETTLTALRKLSNIEIVDKTSEIVNHNCKALWKQLKWLSNQPKELRLFRVSSNFIPATNVPDLDWLHALPSFKKILEDGLAGVRDFADINEIRLCTHPGQFTNICSTSESVVEASILDLESHALLASLMGYGDTWHSSGFAINIHGNYRQDPKLERFQKVINNKVSPIVRNLITLENDEFSCSVDQIIESKIGENIALILDFHHHFIQSKGEYLDTNDDRLAIFKNSWRDIRPLSHFSTSSLDILKNHDSNLKPDFAKLLLEGHKPGKLRSHSYMCWNNPVNEWIVDHLYWTDIEVEAKAKNLAAHQLYEVAKTLNN